MKNERKVSVIILTLNAEKYIYNFLKMMHTQTVLPCEILVVDLESEDDTVKIASSFELVRVISIKRKEFDHGGTRDIALKESVGDYVLFFTQDAEVVQKEYIENIISNFDDEDVAMVCGRQVAKPDAVPYEKLIREFNYPNERRVRSAADIKRLGVKAFYMSDACSAYRRSTYFELGGFEHPILTNEDMLIAAKAIKSGYKTVYDPRAYVLHSHNYTMQQEYKRNFDVAAFMTMHKEFFAGISVTSEGFSLVKYVSVRLLRKLKILSFIRFGFICIAKFSGNRRGNHLFSLTEKKILKSTGNKTYWESTAFEVLKSHVK